MTLTRLTPTRPRSPRRTPSALAGLLACAALAVLVLGAGACASTQPPGQQIDDAGITAKVKTKITADPELNPFDIDVDTLDGVVSLRGAVPTEEKAAEAAKLARYTEGVINVENHLRIRRDMTAGERVADATLASEIDAKLIADPQVAANNIDVDVQDGVVTLSGVVKTDLARKHAEELAQRVDGVRRVINQLEAS